MSEGSVPHPTEEQGAAAAAEPRGLRYASDAERRQAYKDKWVRYRADVEQMAAGRWLFLLEQLAPLVVPAIERLGKGVPCPSHGGKDGFRLFKNAPQTGGGVCNTCGPKPTGFMVLEWVNNWDSGQSVRAVGSYLGLEWEDAKAEVYKPRTTPPIPLQSPAQVSAQRRRADMKAVQRIKDLWENSAPIDWTADTPATRYFRYRGLEAIFEDPPQDLRLHPALPIYGSKTLRDAQGKVLRGTDGSPRTQPVLVATLPAILACVRAPQGHIVAFHRIWVTPEGHKPDLSHPDLDPKDYPKHKQLAGLPSWLTIKGAAVRLYSPGRVLGYSEGIETGLGSRLLMAVRQQGRKIAIWAGISATGLEQIEPPPVAEEHLIFADNDEAGSGLRDTQMGRGEEAGIFLRNRLLDDGGARIYLPPRVGIDWLDVWNSVRTRMGQISHRYAAAYMTDEEFAAYQAANPSQVLEPEPASPPMEDDLPPPPTEEADATMAAIQRARLRGRGEPPMDGRSEVADPDRPPVPAAVEPPEDDLGPPPVPAGEENAPPTAEDFRPPAAPPFVKPRIKLRHEPLDEMSGL